MRNKVREFAAVMEELRDRCETDSVSELIDHVIKDTGYLEMLELGKLDHSESRIENLEELISSAVEFEKNSDDKSLTAYLETVALTAETDKYDSEEGKILLMTLHNAKGLEFPVVFLPGVEEGYSPTAVPWTTQRKWRKNAVSAMWASPAPRSGCICHGRQNAPFTDAASLRCSPAS